MDPVEGKAVNSKKNFLEKITVSRYVAGFAAVAVFAVSVYSLMHLSTGRAAVTPVVYEAETFTLPSKAEIRSDSATSNGQYVLLFSNGSLTKTVTTTSDTLDVAVKAKSSSCSGAANMSLIVDGKTIMTKTTSNSWTAYAQAYSLKAGTHTVAVAFTNDYSARKCDRNLYVDVVSLTPVSTTTTTPPPTVPTSLAITTPFKMTSGTSGVSGWNADGGYSGGSTANYTGTVALGTSTTPEAIYRNERYGAFTNTFTGLDASKTYSLNLHFIESYVNAAGQRIFNVTVNNNPVLTNFDIFAQAGGKGIALVKSFTFTPDANGTVAIAFVAGTADNPKVCAIEIDVASSTATTTPPPTTTPTPPPSPQKILRSATFDTLPISDPITPANFNAVLGGTNNNTVEYDDTSVVADSRGTGNVLRTKLDPNTIRSNPAGNNGIVVFPPLTSVDNACMSYDIKFDSNFEFSLGGKLPGLEGVVPGTSPSDPTGGHPTDMGWSGRMMWLGPKAYSWAGPINMAVSYMYHPGQTDIYGDNVRWNKAFVAGQWHTVKQCYVMNTPGMADGTLQAWFDGTQVLDLHNFVYRSAARSDLHINYINWSIFRGGGDLTWASSRVGYIDIDNVLVTTQ